MAHCLVPANPVKAARGKAVIAEGQKVLSRMRSLSCFRRLHDSRDPNGFEANTSATHLPEWNADPVELCGVQDIQETLIKVTKKLLLIYVKTLTLQFIFRWIFYISSWLL